MELLNTLYNLMGLVFVLGTICSMGLSLTMAQITGPLRNTRFVIVALLANFLVPPILAFLLIQLFALDEPLAVGLLLVSLAAGAPSLPKTAVFAKVDTAAATGLMVLLVVTTIIILPIALPLLLTGISVTFWDIASGPIILILVPLAVSLFVRARYPEAAASALPHFAQASNLSLLILMNIPLALVGGVAALWISGQNLSVPSSIGFIALFGIAVLNGLVMVEFFRNLEEEGKNRLDAVLEGAELRLRPVLMTAATTMLALVPLAVGLGEGGEAQAPLARAVLGGLLSSTVITLVDEGKAPLQEDVIINAFDDCITIQQVDPRTDQAVQITLSLSQLRDLQAALDLPEGIYQLRKG